MGNYNSTSAVSAAPIVHRHVEADMPQNRMKAKSYSRGTSIEIKYDADDNQDDDEKDDVDGVRESFHFYDESNPPPKNSKVLLHSCCAPCSGAMFEEMVRLGYDVTIFFYNPNVRILYERLVHRFSREGAY